MMSDNEQTFNKNLASREKNTPGWVIFDGTKLLLLLHLL
jgi:hypothetical protein